MSVLPNGGRVMIVWVARTTKTHSFSRDFVGQPAVSVSSVEMEAVLTGRGNISTDFRLTCGPDVGREQA